MAMVIDHMESKFEPGMTWSNWGPGKVNWHFAHKDAVAGFNLDDPVEVHAACNLSNYFPQWGLENIKDGDKQSDGTRARTKRTRAVPEAASVAPAIEAATEEPPVPDVSPAAVAVTKAVAEVSGNGCLLDQPAQWYFDKIKAWLFAYKEGSPEATNKGWERNIVGTTLHQFADQVERSLDKLNWADEGKTWRLVVEKMDKVDTSSVMRLNDGFKRAHWYVEVISQRRADGEPPQNQQCPSDVFEFLELERDRIRQQEMAKAAAKASTGVTPFLEM